MARTGLERFQARQGKMKGDEKAIHESAMKKQMTADMYDELKDEGNIEEAAMVVSRDGMKLLGQMLTNSIESSMDRVLDRKLDEKLGQLLSGLHKGILEGLLAVQETAVAKTEEKIEQAVTKASEQLVAEINLSETPSIDKTIEKVKKNMGIDLGGKVTVPDLSKLDDIVEPNPTHQKSKELFREYVDNNKKEKEKSNQAQKVDKVMSKALQPDTAPKEPFTWDAVPEKQGTRLVVRPNKPNFLTYCPIIVEYLEKHPNQPTQFKDINDYATDTYNVTFGTKSSKFMEFVSLKDSRITRHSYGQFILKP